MKLACWTGNIQHNSFPRADSVCTACGTVLESGIIVSDVQVVKLHTRANPALFKCLNTTIVSISSKRTHTEEAQPSALLSLLIAKAVGATTLEVGWPNSFMEIFWFEIGAFNSGVGRESREITLKNARKKIQALAQQLRLRPDHIDMVNTDLWTILFIENQ